MTLNPDTLNVTNQTNVPPTSPPATLPGQQPGATGQSGTQTPPETPPATAPGQQSGPTGVNLTKEQLEERVAQAKRSGVREIFEALGFTGLDDPTKLTQAQTDLAELVKFARDQKRAALTAEEQVKADLATAQQTATTAEEARTKAETERDATNARLKAYILRTEITNAAVGAAHPSDVYDAFAIVHMKDKLAEVIKADVPMFTEAGAFNPECINQDAVKAIVDKCKEDRKEWWAPGTNRIVLGVPSNAGATPPPADVTKLEKQMELARAAIRRL